MTTMSKVRIQIPAQFSSIGDVIRADAAGKIVPFFRTEDEDGDLSQYGRDAVQRWRGFLFDEWNKDLTGARGYRVFREMRDSSPAVNAVVTTLENMAKKVTWTMQPSSKPLGGKKKTKKWAKEAQKWADFAQTCLEDMSMTWEQCLEQFVSAVWYGFYYGEIVYKERKDGKYKDGLLGWSRFVNTGAQYVFEWVYNEADQQVIGLVQNPPNGAAPAIFIPKSKALHITFSSETGSPQGRSCLRAAYPSWRFLKNLQALEGVGYEKDVGGVPIARVPASMLSDYASSEEQAALDIIKTQLAGLRKGSQSYLIFPSKTDAVGETGFDIQFAQTSQGGANAAIDVAIRRYQQEIARCMLAEYMYLGSGDNGSWALSSDKTSTFIEAVRGMLDTIAALFTRQCVNRLMAANGVDPDFWPSLVYSGLDRPDVAKLGGYITQLHNAGVPVSDEETAMWLRAMGGLPTVVAPPEDGPQSPQDADTGTEPPKGDGKLRT